MTADCVLTVTGSESAETQEDVYVASVETDRGVKEQLRLYDTKGLHDGQDLPKHYYSVADGFVLVYSIDSLESFRRVDMVKKEIDKSRDKKEACLQYLNSSGGPPLGPQQIHRRLFASSGHGRRPGQQERPAGATAGGTRGGAAVGSG